uniref:hypothetical protein n=1 Tax=Paractinoplanes polyasparticus TaxID=2856853 RepID=UPI001C85408E|nr:hypothetical protein [Actinoplanes polyasparticus]
MKRAICLLVGLLAALCWPASPAQAHAFAYTPESKPLRVEEWTVTAALPAQGIEPLDNPVATVTTTVPVK